MCAGRENATCMSKLVSQGSGLGEGGLSFPNPLLYEEEWRSPAKKAASGMSFWKQRLVLARLKVQKFMDLGLPSLQKLEKVNVQSS